LINTATMDPPKHSPQQPSSHSYSHLTPYPSVLFYVFSSGNPQPEDTEKQETKTIQH